jgi:hypothetical protein
MGTARPQAASEAEDDTRLDVAGAQCADAVTDSMLGKEVTDCCSTDRGGAADAVAMGCLVATCCAIQVPTAAPQSHLSHCICLRFHECHSPF